MKPLCVFRCYLRTSRVILACGLMSTLTTSSGVSQVRPEVMQLVRIKKQVQHHLSRTENLTCIETVQRTRFGKKGKPRHADTVRLEVAFADGKEVFSWPGESEFRNSDIAEIVGGGTLSTGGFLAAARAVFVSSGAVTSFAGEETVNGRALVRYDYRVPLLESGYQVAFGGQGAFVPFSGSFWADKDTDGLVRLTSEAEDIPPTVPIKGATRSIDYGLVRIGEELVVVPQSVDEELRLWSGEVNRNRTGFTHWREYRSSSRISFSDVDLAPATPSETPREVLRQLQPGLRIKATLSSRIDSRSAQIGDDITAQVATEVKQKKQIVIPAGATMIGRIRWLDKQEKRCLLGVEFSEIRWDGNVALFFGRLESARDASGIVRDHIVRTRDVSTLSVGSAVAFQGFAGFFRMSAPESTGTTETISMLDIPGVALLTVESNPFQLSSRVVMDWITERP